MNRIEIIRDVVDNLLLGMFDLQERRTAYVQSAYTTMDTTEHAHKSAIMSKELLVGVNIFTETEIGIALSESSQ